MIRIQPDEIKITIPAGVSGLDQDTSVTLDNPFDKNVYGLQVKLPSSWKQKIMEALIEFLSSNGIQVDVQRFQLEEGYPEYIGLIKVVSDLENVDRLIALSERQSIAVDNRPNKIRVYIDSNTPVDLDYRIEEKCYVAATAHSDWQIMQGLIRFLKENGINTITEDLPPTGGVPIFINKGTVLKVKEEQEIGRLIELSERAPHGWKTQLVRELEKQPQGHQAILTP